MAGTLVISLDFELYWGVRDKRPLDACAEALRRTRAVVPRLLELFQRRGVHATWATVGFLFCASAEEAMARAPGLRPTYARGELSPYPHLEGLAGENVTSALHFAPDLVRRIVKTPGQELATHTFSHFYCKERGATPAQFAADLRAAQAVAADLGCTLESLVFPRNQVDEAALAVARELGLLAYRGNEHGWAYRARGGEAQRPWIRLARLADAYVPVTRTDGYDPPTAAPLPVNVRASRFLRPYDPRLRALEPLRLARISASLRRAARRGQVYHLWWHPENFGQHPQENLAFLDRVLQIFEEERTASGMRSLSMSELARELSRPAGAGGAPSRAMHPVSS